MVVGVIGSAGLLGLAVPAGVLMGKGELTLSVATILIGTLVAGFVRQMTGQRAIRFVCVGYTLIVCVISSVMWFTAPSNQPALTEATRPLAAIQAQLLLMLLLFVLMVASAGAAMGAGLARLLGLSGAADR